MSELQSLAEMSLENSPNPESKPTSLMRLPCELRLEIYFQLLTAPEILRTLRGDDRKEYDPHTPIYALHPTAILRTSRTIYAEALPILYHNNHFSHCITANALPSSIPFTLHLNMMRHLDLNYIVGHSRENLPLSARTIDRTISLQLRAIAANCPQLRTFHLRMAEHQNGSPYADPNDVLETAMMDAADTPLAFAAVATKVRDWVSLWYTNPLTEAAAHSDDAWECLREAVAGKDCWEPFESRDFRGIHRRSVAYKAIATEWWCDVGELKKQG